MPKFIQHRRTESVQHHELRFVRQGDDASRPAKSFMYFDCGADGTVDVAGMSPMQQACWWTAQDRRVYQAPIQVDWTSSVMVPAIIECGRCYRNVHLYQFTNTCMCGLDYSMTGQLLAPRSQWGEETGESAEDVLQAGHHAEG